MITNREDSRKSILKRDTHSFDEARQSSYLCPDRGGMLDRKAKSFEEREEDYDRARSRIFNRSQNESCPVGGGSTDDDNNYISWTSSVDQQQFARSRSSGKVLKIQNVILRDIFESVYNLLKKIYIWYFMNSPQIIEQ